LRSVLTTWLPICPKRKANVKAILGSKAAFEVRYLLPVVWELSERRVAVLMEKWAGYSYWKTGSGLELVL
jgi:hypothetical protein